MSKYNKPVYFKVKIDEIKHTKAKEVAEKVGLIEYGTTNKNKLEYWKQRKVEYEDISCYAEGKSECYKYGKGRNTKYYYRTPIYTPFTHTIDHYSYGVFTQEPSERELEVLLMGGESVKNETKDVVRNVSKSLFKQVFGFNLPSFNLKNLFKQEEDQQEDIIDTLHNFLETKTPNEKSDTIEKPNHEELQQDQIDYNELKMECDYGKLIKQMDNYQYESNDMIIKF